MPRFDAEDREAYRVIFKSVLGYSVFLFCAYLLTKVAFMPKESLNEHTGTIVGFITGSAFALILGFYFGSSDKKERKRIGDNDEEIDQIEGKKIDSGEKLQLISSESKEEEN